MKGGKGHRRAKKAAETTTDIPFRDDDQHYARVERLLGDGRMLVGLPDGSHVTAHVRGRMRKRVWVAVGDLVLVAAREGLGDTTVDVVHKYSRADATYLEKVGEVLFDDDENEGDGGGVRFADGDDAIDAL